MRHRVQADRRRARPVAKVWLLATVRAGAPTPRSHAPICGQRDPLCFEADHLDRRANGDIVWGACLNCHRRKSAREQSEHPPVGIHPGDPFEGMGHALLGMHQYLSFIAERLPAMAEVMFKLAGQGIIRDD